MPSYAEIILSDRFGFLTACSLTILATLIQAMTLFKFTHSVLPGNLNPYADVVTHVTYHAYCPGRSHVPARRGTLSPVSRGNPYARFQSDVIAGPAVAAARGGGPGSPPGLRRHNSQPLGRLSSCDSSMKGFIRSSIDKARCVRPGVKSDQVVQAQKRQTPDT